MVVTEERHDWDEALGELDDTVPDEIPETETQATANEEDFQPKPKERFWWQKIWRFFFQNADQREETTRKRLFVLNRAVDLHPDAAVNYVLRGELHLELRLWDAAQQDFEQALELAQKQYNSEKWGLASQAIQDRARQGLHIISTRRNLI